MAAELRWILLALSLVLLAGIWWWGRRRSSQAPGDAQLRETTVSIEPQRAEAAANGEIDAVVERETAIEWGIPPLEPLSIRTQEYEHVPVLDGPMMVSADPAPLLVPAAAPAMSAVAAVPPAPAVIPGRVPTLVPESVPNASEQQKIVTVRVCAPGEVRWSGSTLLSALELHGLAYGRHQVFHRRHVDGRSLFCVASLIEPGTFDVARMSTEEFRGVTLFAVLPGPVEPLLTVDELLGAARGLAQELSGMVQDQKGMPLSPQRAAALRDDVARFQAALPRA
jgi:FtsZ-interacting cell division protein ZipA